MKSLIFGMAVLVGLAALFLIFYDHPFFDSSTGSPVAVEPPADQALEIPAVKYPVPPPPPAAETTEVQTPPEQEPQPALPEPTLAEILAEQIQQETLYGLLQLQNLVQRFVVTIDSLPEKRVSPHHLPVAPPPGKFMATGGSISPENAKRYAIYLQMIDTLGVERAVEIYVRFYNLFQAAYRELGYPRGHFNDRFVAVIDHLLATPKAEEPLAVVQPLMVYKYSDPELESLSAGQKLMLRIGSENRVRLTAILQELRDRITNLK